MHASSPRRTWSAFHAPFLLAAGFLAAAAPPAAAQRPPALDSGAQVRAVRAWGTPRVVQGVFAHRAGDSLVILVGDERAPHAVGLRELASLDVRGPRTHVAEGMLVGGAFGAAMTGFAGWAIGSWLLCLDGEVHGCLLQPDVRRGLVVGGAVGGGVVGMLLGGAWGAVHRREGWVRVPIEGAVALEVAPAPGGLGLALHIRARAP